MALPSGQIHCVPRLQDYMIVTGVALCGADVLDTAMLVFSKRKASAVLSRVLIC